MADKIQIITYLNILELPTDKPITEDIIQSSYRKLSKIYHPDVANERYSDGKKFIQLQDAREYLIKHISEVNSLIRNGFSSSNSNSYSTSNEAYERWKQEQEFQRRQKEEQEAKRRAEEAERKRREEEQRRQEEIRRKKEADEKRRREEQELRRRIKELKAQKIVEAKKLLDDLNKEDYYDEDYNKICAATMSFVDYINGIIVKADLSIISSINNKFQSLVKYIESTKTIQQIKTKRKIKIGSIITLSSIAFVTVFIILLIVIIPLSKYNHANKLLSSGNFNEAHEIFNELGDYKNSQYLSSKTRYLSKIIDDSVEYFEYDKIAADCHKYDIKISINYNPQGGVLIDNSLTYKIAQKVGYTFKTWRILNKQYDFKTNILLIDVSAIYGVITYNIKYDLDGGMANNPSSYNIESNLIIHNPTKKGYTFIGWQDTITGNIVDSLLIEKGNYGNKSYKALYENNIYSVIFDSSGGDTIDPVDVTFGGSVLFPKPKRAGYLFKGWFHDGERVYHISKYDYDFDYTVTAEWTPITYSITCIYENGQDNTIINYDITSNNIELEQPSMEGYDFVGWSTEKDGQISENVIIEHGSIGDKVFYANWSINEYSIDYNLYNGINSVKNPIIFTIKDIESGNICLYDPYLEGYRFDGWFLEPEFINQIFNISELRDIELYARFNKYYMIQYLDMYNEIEIYQFFTEIDGNILLDEINNDYYFSEGWFLDAEFNQPINQINASSKENKLLYIKWEPIKYSIEYELFDSKNNENNPMEYTILDDNVELFAPHKEYYEFIGWYDSENFENKIEHLNVKDNGNIKLFAKFEPIKYSIQYELFESENNENNPEEYTILDNNIELFAPHKENYEFIGWYDSESFESKIEHLNVKENGNIKLFAKFEPIYIITYNMNGGRNNLDNPDSFYRTEKIELVDPIKDHFDFEGWFLDKEYTIPFLGTDVEENNINLFAKFSLQTFLENGLLYCYYGNYPQTVVDDELLLNELNSNYSNGTLILNDTTGYYLYNDHYYCRYNYNNSSYCTFSNGKVGKNEVYWFACEAVKWRVISAEQDNYVLLSEHIIDDYIYDNSYSINAEYLGSNIHESLNTIFINSCFTLFERNSICGEISLLTYDDCINADYGFGTNENLSDVNRIAMATDYAIARGCFTNNSIGEYWINPISILYPYNHSASYVTMTGELVRMNTYSQTNVSDRRFGTRPLMVLN